MPDNGQSRRAVQAFGPQSKVREVVDALGEKGTGLEDEFARLLAIDRDADQVARQAKNVDIVVAAAHFRHDFIAARSSANSFEFVGHDGHPKARTTDENSPLRQPVSYDKRLR